MGSEAVKKRRANDATSQKAQKEETGDAGSKSIISRLAGAFGLGDELSEGEDGLTRDPLLDSAVTMMKNLRVKPTPMAYTIFYTHVSGDRPQLSKFIRQVRKSGDKFNATLIAETYERFFGAEQESHAVYEASRNIERLLTVVQETMTTAGNSTANHGERISALNDDLVQQDKVEEIRKITAGIISETTRMRMSINKLERRVVHSAAEIAGLRENLEQAQREASADALTGIANRKVLLLELNRAVKDAESQKKPFSFLVIEVDQFHEFNDEYGHLIGDAALKLVARTLDQAVKRRDLAARFDTERFGVVLVETPIEGAIALAEKLKNQISTVCLENEGVGSKIRPVTVSIGVAQYRQKEPLKRLVGRADRALIHAKDNDRNQVASERDIEVIGRPKTKPKAVRA